MRMTMDERIGDRFMDEELRILKAGDTPAALAALAALDDRIIGALAVRRQEAAATRRLMAFAAFVSLGGGIVAGSAVSQPAMASPLSPLAPASALAPSVLLDVH